MTILEMKVEDAAKMVISAGLVVPEYQHGLKELKDAAEHDLELDVTTPLKDELELSMPEITDKLKPAASRKRRRGKKSRSTKKNA